MTSTDRYTVEYGIYRTQVFRKPSVLHDVPDEYKTYELCLAAFVFDEVASLQYVPERHKTYELCLTAVKCCGTNIFYVPADLMTDEIKLAAMQQNHYIKFDDVAKF